MLAILDDVFPDLTTGFRVAEYNWYLDAFPQLTVFSTNYYFEAAHTRYAAIYPEYAGRIVRYADTSLDGCGFAYMNFLNNAALFLPELERRKIPFLFTLYPGGGFGLNDPESDTKLDSVLASPQLRGVIVTQPVTLDYLAGRIDPAIVHEINGVTINPKHFAEPNGVPVLPEVGAARICLVAERYMERGANKGYPEFIAAASTLAREFPNLLPDPAHHHLAQPTVPGLPGPTSMASQPAAASRPPSAASPSSAATF